MKSKIVLVLKFFARYVIPVVLGWLEGDSHVLSDTLTSLCGF